VVPSDKFFVVWDVLFSLPVAELETEPDKVMRRGVLIPWVEVVGTVVAEELEVVPETIDGDTVGALLVLPLRVMGVPGRSLLSLVEEPICDKVCDDVLFRVVEELFKWIDGDLMILEDPLMYLELKKPE
jgi:hypothetical protein